MKSLRQIMYESLMSTSHFPRWWILALLQAASLYLIGELLQPHYWIKSPLFLCWPILAVFIMVPTTAWLWLDIEAVKLKRANQILTKVFVEYCVASSIIVLFSMIPIIAAKFIYPDWLFSALLSSIVSGTSTLAILYVVLCRQPFNKALVLAIDTWNKKISMAALSAFALLLTHGISFALVHGVLKSLKNSQGFSVLADSATIWMLFLVLAGFVAFAAAFLNCFLVLLFLEIISRKKDPESEKAVITKLVTSEANSYNGSSLKIG